MKKFILGLVCGLTIGGVGVAAAASNEIKAILFPTDVTYHLDGQNIQSDSEDIVLNYNNRLYVPLRAFAEKMGSTVDYHAPEPGGTTARVDIYNEDERDLTLRDEGGFVGMGHVSVQFANEGDPAVTSGTVKFTKRIPADKQVVIAILDKDGNKVAETEAIRLQYHDVHDMAEGEIANFKANFPYMEPVKDYKLQVQVVEKPVWSYSQTLMEAVVTGAGGMNGFPIGTRIDAIYGGMKGQPVGIQVTMMNLSDEDTLEIRKPITFEVEILKQVGNTRQLIRTLKTEPFGGTIFWKKGCVDTTVVWDQKDSKGAAVPAGEYLVSLRLPATAEGTYLSAPNEPVTFTLEDSMQTIRPVEIK